MKIEDVSLSKGVFLSEEETNVLKVAYKELRDRIDMVNNHVNVREKHNDFSMPTETIKIMLNDPLEDFQELNKN